MNNWKNFKFLTVTCDREMYEISDGELYTTGKIVILNCYDNLTGAKRNFHNDQKEWNEKSTSYQRAIFLSFAIIKNPYYRMI